jgi:hypothetical protein
MRRKTTFPRSRHFAYDRQSRPERQTLKLVRHGTIWEREREFLRTLRNLHETSSDWKIWIFLVRGCSSMVEQKLPKLTTRVRFPSPAPTQSTC